MTHFKQCPRIAIQWLIALSILLANFASALTIEEIDQTVLAKYPTVNEFLRDADGIELYFKNLEEYFGASHFPRDRYNAILNQLRLAVAGIPGFGEMVWSQKHEGRPYEIHTALKTSGRRLDTEKWAAYLKQWKLELSQEAKVLMDYKDESRALVGANTAYRNLTSEIEIFEQSIADLNKKQQGIKRGEFWQSSKIKDDGMLKAANAFIMLKILSDPSVSTYLESSDADIVIAVLEKIKNSKQLKLAFEIPQQAHTFLKNMVLIGQPLFDKSDSFPVIMRTTRQNREVPVDPTGVVAYRFKPIPRRIHGIWQGIRLGECVGGRCGPTYAQWLTPRRWAVPVMPSTRDYFIEKSGLSNGGAQSSVSYVGFLQEVPVMTQGNEKFFGVEFGSPDMANEIVVEDAETGLLQKRMFAHEWLRRTPDQKMHVVGESGAMGNSGVRGVLDKTMSFTLADQPFTTGYDLVDRRIGSLIAQHSAQQGYPDHYGTDMITELSVPNVQRVHRYLNDFENIFSVPQKLADLISNPKITFENKTKLVQAIESYHAPQDIILAPLFALLHTSTGADANYRILILSAIAYYKPSSLQNLRPYSELFLRYPEMDSLFLPFIETLHKLDITDPIIESRISEVLSAKFKNPAFSKTLINELKTKEALTHSEILYHGLVRLEGSNEFSKFSKIENKGLAWLLSRSRTSFLSISDPHENSELIKWIFNNPEMSDVITQAEAETILKKACSEYSKFEEIFSILQKGRFPQLQNSIVQSKDKILVGHFMTSFAEGKHLEYLEKMYDNVFDTPELKDLYGNELNRTVYKLFRDDKFWIKKLNSGVLNGKYYTESSRLEKIYIDLMPKNVVFNLDINNVAKILLSEDARQVFLRRSTPAEANQALLLLAAGDVRKDFFKNELYLDLINKGVTSASDYGKLSNTVASGKNITLKELMLSNSSIKILKLRAQLASRVENQKDIPHIFLAYNKIGTRDLELERYLRLAVLRLKTNLGNWLSVMEETRSIKDYATTGNLMKSLADVLPKETYETATSSQLQIILSNPINVDRLYSSLNENSAFLITKTFLQSKSLSRNFSEDQLAEMCELGLNSKSRYHEFMDIISTPSEDRDTRIVKMVMMPQNMENKLALFDAVADAKYQDFLVMALPSLLNDPAVFLKIQPKLDNVLKANFSNDPNNWFRFIKNIANKPALLGNAVVRKNVLLFADSVYDSSDLNKVADVLALKLMRDHVVEKSNRQQSLKILNFLINMPTAIDMFSSQEVIVLTKKSFASQKEYFSFFEANPTISAKILLERTFLAMTGEEINLKETGKFIKKTGYKIPTSFLQSVVQGRTLKNIDELYPVVYIGTDEVKKQNWHLTLESLATVDLSKINGREMFMFLDRRAIGATEFKAALPTILPRFKNADQYADFFQLNLLEEYSIGRSFAENIPFSNVSVKKEILNYGHLLFALDLSYDDVMKLEKRIFSKFDAKTRTDFYMKHLNDIAALNWSQAQMRSFYSSLKLESRSQRFVELTIQSSVVVPKPSVSSRRTQCLKFYGVGLL